MIEVYWRPNENMAEVRDRSVKLVLTSPHQPTQFDRNSLSVYFKGIRNVIQQCHNKLDGRGFLVWANTDNYHKGTLFLRHLYFCDIIKSLNFNIFAMKIWHRLNYTDLRRPTFSYMILACKGRKPKEIQKRTYKMPFRSDVWSFDDHVLWRKYGAFPPELVKRCVLTLTNEGEIVLDPYMGSGTTVLVAHKLNRVGVGYEIDVELKRVFEERALEILGANVEVKNDFQ